MMMQTLAIFRDAYRELNAKKLFWIVLAISGLVVAAFGAVGLNEKGLTILWWEFPSVFNSVLFPPAVFYKLMFANLGVKIWLAWIAAILALVSVASMIPDFISSGSIELSLSKPLGRARLFLTKYLAGLLFVTLQVLVFTVAAFLVIGLRGKAWEPSLFWAVPLTVLCFSYIYAVCALLGLLTRSTIASLLLTLLFWFALFGLNSTENVLLTFRTMREMQVERRAEAVAELEQQKLEHTTNATAEASGDDARPASGWPGASRLETAERRLEQAKASRRTMARWHGAFFAIMTVLPKTSATTEILERKLISDADLQMLRDNQDSSESITADPDGVPIDSDKMQQRVQDILRSRSVAWVIGTSLAFQAFILAIATWIFSRREF